MRLSFLVGCLTLGGLLVGGRAPGAEAVTVLRGARIIDGTGGAPLENATMILEGPRIQALGPADQVHVPEGATVIDCTGKTLIPGLISNHSHVGQVDGTSSGEPALYTRDNVLRQLRQYAAYGVTTVVSLGVNKPEVFLPLREELHAGTLPGADLFGADHGLGVPAGAPPAAMMKAGPDQLDRPSTPTEARNLVKAAAARHADLIKIWFDDFNGSLPKKMKPEIYRAIIDEAHSQGLRVAAHIYHLEDARSLVRAGVDILAHGIRDGLVDEALVRDMKNHGTWYIPTLQLDEAFFIYAEQPGWMKQPFFQHAVQPALARQFADSTWREKTLGAKNIPTERQALVFGEKNLKTLHDAGVHIGFGTDSGATPLRIPGFAEHRELQLMTEAGLTPLQALEVATRGAATLLKLEDRGTLAPGKRADFLVLDGDPSHDIHQVDSLREVWQRGQRIGGPVEQFTP